MKDDLSESSTPECDGQMDRTSRRNDDNGIKTASLTQSEWNSLLSNLSINQRPTLALDLNVVSSGQISTLNSIRNLDSVPGCIGSVQTFHSSTVENRNLRSDHNQEKKTPVAQRSSSSYKSVGRCGTDFRLAVNDHPFPLFVQSTQDCERNRDRDAFACIDANQLATYNLSSIFS